MNNEAIVKSLLETNVFLKKYDFILDDMKHDKENNKAIKLHLSTIHVPVETKAGLINVEIKTLCRLKLNFTNLLHFKKTYSLMTNTKISIKLNDICSHKGWHELIIYENRNNKYIHLLINHSESDKIIYHKIYKANDLLSLQKDFISIFLNRNELESLGAASFKDLKDDWYEIYNMLHY